MTFCPYTNRLAEPGSILPQLDGVRGLACMIVFLSHAGASGSFFPLGNAGQLGVMLFFTLSGFLMVYHYMPGRLSWRYWLSFLTRRMFRVYPAFFVAVLSCYALHVITGLHYFQPYRLSQMLDNLFLQVPLRIYWTVGVEIQFYLLFPLLACMLLVLPWQAHTKTFLLATAWAISLFMVPALDLGSVWSFIGFFLGGMLAGQLYLCASGILCTRIAPQAWNTIATLCLAGLVLLVPAVSRVVFGWDYGQWEHYHLIAPLMLLTVLSLAYSQGFLHSLFSSRPARFVGAISYSLYLMHYTVFILMQDYTDLPAPLGFLVNFAIAMLLAWGLYRWVEYPLNQIGKRLSARMEHGE